MVALSVIVPATNGPTTLARCLDAVRRAGPDEVVVVEGPAELSAAGARNLGASRTTGDVLVFIDADVEVHADALSRIRKAFAQRPRLTAVFGSYDDAPAAPGTVSVFRNLLHHHVHHAGAGPAATFWSGLGAVRREAFLAAGGFDDRRFPNPSIEDIELGERLAAGGAQIVLDPTIQGTHLKAWTLPSMLWTDFARRGVPWVRLRLRTRRGSTALNLGWRHRLSAAASLLGAVSAARGRPRGLITAAVALAGLNHAFYGLLLRRTGPRGVAAGMVLHALHHLTAVGAAGTGCVLHAGSLAAPTLHLLLARARAVRARRGGRRP